MRMVANLGTRMLDSTPQGYAKGKTVKVGRGSLKTSSQRYTILHASGHMMFVMTFGATQDEAILVISACNGEFEIGFEIG